MKPTKEEIEVAHKVLKAFEEQASKLSEKTEQDYPYEISRGLEVWLDILASGDPEKWLKDYEDEYDAGH